MTTIPIADLWRYDLRAGNSDHPRHGACLYDAANWLLYGRIGDDPPCACPVIRKYAIGLNDAMPDPVRQRLKPFILRVIGNRDQAAEPARLRLIVLETARRILPLALDHLPTQQAALRALPDDAPYEQIAAAAAYDAADAADAAAYAAAAADAAADADLVWSTALDILDRALRIGRQSPEFDLPTVTRSIAAFDLAAAD